MPAITAAGVASNWKSAGMIPMSLSGPEDDAVVRQDDLPRDGPQQEAREERRDDHEQQQVLVGAAAERDGVGQREPERERQDRGQPAVHDRPADPRPVLLERLRVDPPVPALLEAVVDVPGPQRDQEHLDRRVDVEDGQEQQARREQRVRGDLAEVDRPPHRRLEAHDLGVRLGPGRLLVGRGRAELVEPRHPVLGREDQGVVGRPRDPARS